MRAFGQPLVDAADRLDGVTALGVDEHVWQRAGRGRRTAFGTGIVDLTPGRPARLLDVLPGRTGTVYASWIGQREQVWRDRIELAALDPFRGYATALRTQLPQATRVLDCFHVVKLANQMVDEVRRRVQQQTLGHRGHKDDPLFEARRLLRRGVEHLTDRQAARLGAALAAGDPDGETTLAWQIAQALRGCYHARQLPDGRRQADAMLDTLHTCPIPEAARLGRSLRSWRPELLAYFDTDRALERPHRGDEPAGGEDPPDRPRLQELRQLPAATAVGLRRRLAHSRHATNQEPPTTLGGVEPAKSRPWKKRG